MNDQSFIRIIHEAFQPFLSVLGFLMDAPSLSGNFYEASFSGPNHVVSISYEPGADFQLVLIFGRDHGEQSDIDESSATPRLADLNKRYMHLISDDERAKNDVMFSFVRVTDRAEALLLKSAKELSLVLPNHLNM
jgi:hypothetical protein